jgi:phosphoglycerate kinase
MPTDAWQADFAMYDLGPKTIAHYQTLIAKARTILWAGPMGVYEHPNYRTGSVAMADAIGHSKAHRVIGGGDTVAVLDYSHVTDKNFTHISTGGGAFLAYFSGLKLLSYLPNLRDDHATTTH